MFWQGWYKEDYVILTVYVFCQAACTANNFEFMYTRQRIRQNSFLKFIYIFSKSFVIFRQDPVLLSAFGRIHIIPKGIMITNMMPALQRQNTKISKQIFQEKEYRGLGPNFHIHASVSDLYIHTIGLPTLLEEVCRPILGLYKSLTDI